MKNKIFLFFIGFLFLTPFISLAQVFESSNYRVLDLVMSSGFEYATSSDYRLYGSIGELSIGTSTVTDFRDSAGFLYFPYVSLPVLSVISGDAQATLSWTAATSALGWTVNGYSVGQSTSSGGPYTYTALGNVLTTTRTGLTNGTTYYFVIRVLDTFSNGIATTTEASVTPTGSGGGGGGGGGGGPPGLFQGQPNIVFSGLAFPYGEVKAIQGNRVLGEVSVDSTGRFQINARTQPGVHNFLLLAEDPKGVLSNPLSYTVNILAGSTFYISDIVFPPTLSFDKREVRKGERVSAFGFFRPAEIVNILARGEGGSFNGLSRADLRGYYEFSIATGALSAGYYEADARVDFLISLVRKFIVGEKTVFNEPSFCPELGDLNRDCRVDLIDFSIAAFWWEKTINPAFAEVEKESLNGDGAIDLVDFSIMAYWWTG